MNKERLILVVNDDSYLAPGIGVLIEVASKYGRVVAVAPKEPQSGMSQAFTSYSPLYLDTIYRRDGVELYALNGTPVDCVKFAMDYLLADQKIDLVLSGINHGSNAGINVLYSGTMGAAIEGSVCGVPSIGFSHMNHSNDIDLEPSRYYADKVIAAMLDGGLAELGGDAAHLCLNVNIPDLPMGAIKGMRVVRQNMGYWHETFYNRTDPRGRTYYWLTGEFVNTEEASLDTDLAAIDEGYVSIVPVQADMTAYRLMKSVEGVIEKA